MDQLIKYLPVILPLFLAEFALAITAFVHVQRHPHYKVGNRVIWSIVVLVVQIIGPVAYFVFGRGEEE